MLKSIQNLIKFNTNSIICYYLLVIYLSSLVSVTLAQSKCNTICDQDKDCKTGKCLLSECRDTEFCFEFCFSCSGQRTCFASGIDFL